MNVETIILPLTNRLGTILAQAIVDAADRDMVTGHVWRALKHGYLGKLYIPAAYAIISGKVTLLHRHLMGLRPGDGLEVDHRNRNPLDNRRANLRVVTHAQNHQNKSGAYGTSQHRGVWWERRDRRWVAAVQIGKRRFVVGRFKNEEEAAVAAREGRRRLMPFSDADQPLTVENPGV